MKNRFFRCFTSLTIFLLPISTVFSQGLQFPAGRGLTHLHSAWTLDKGAVTINAHTTSFYKTTLTNNVTGTFWDVQGVVSAAIAPHKHFELYLTNIVYQDTHQGSSGINTPSDVNFAIKAASFGSIKSPVKFGLLAEGRIPLASHHNVVFEPYSSGQFEFGITALGSVTSDLLIPEAGFNLHANVGMWFHNDKGQTITSDPTDNTVATSASRALLWGVGAVLPTSQLDFGLEVSGRMFAVRPPVTAYTRENAYYLTPSINYRANNRASFFAAVDVRLSSDTDLSLYTANGTTLVQVHPDLPSNPGWRLQIGGKYHITKPAPRGLESPLFVEEDENIPALPLQEQLGKERRKTEMAEEQLSKIREDRRKMEDTLAKLRQVLRGDQASREKSENKTESSGGNN